MAKADILLKVGRGCEQCRDTGYLSRLPIHELLVATPEIRDLIAKGRTSREIEEIAIQQGMRTLAFDGARKVLDGLTTLSQIRSVTGE